MLTYKIYPRLKTIDKKGLCPIYIQVIDDRTTYKFTLKLKVDLKHFDLKSNRAKTSMSNYIYVNSILGNCEKAANEIILEHTLSKKQLTYEAFKDRVLGKEKIGESGDFYAFINHRLSDSNFVYGTHKAYKSLRNLLTEYSPKLSFNGLTYEFAIGFRNYLISRGNVENTWTKKLKMLSALINEAIKQDFMTENPIKKIKLRNIDPHRIRLELHEVETLQKLYDAGTLTPYFQNVLQYFLFSCYTGLRYSDVEQFSTDMIVNDMIYIESVKTKETVVIPLLPQAKELLLEGNKNFKVISNQKTNFALKQIMGIAGIKKSVSSHTARHSFATISVSSGLRIEVISKILGHNSLKTTMIYAKIMDEVKVEEMKLWGRKKAVK